MLRPYLCGMALLGWAGSQDDLFPSTLLYAVVLSVSCMRDTRVHSATLTVFSVPPQRIECLSQDAVLCHTSTFVLKSGYAKTKNKNRAWGLDGSLTSEKFSLSFGPMETLCFWCTWRQFTVGRNPQFCLIAFQLVEVRLWWESNASDWSLLRAYCAMKLFYPLSLSSVFQWEDESGWNRAVIPQVQLLVFVLR